ncbi:MAG: glycosyltransferase family 4 protein [Hyphomicrobiaceae bacterium]|nr:glycosyltransferase family 4 protein [Hyphomicrobiaceae bacterium]
MRIAQVAPLIESVPPRLYGGTERIVSYLTEELMALGHDVTLFASGDSITRAELVSCCSQALRLNPAVRDALPYYMLMIDKVRRLAPEFDIIHFHIEQLHFPAFRDISWKTVTTLHGRQDLSDLLPFYSGFPEMPLVAISNAQAKPLPEVENIVTIPHGLPRDLLTPTLRPRGGYLAFVGRISPEKGIERAIRISRATGMQLKIAAKVDRMDVEYFKANVEPMLAHPDIEFVGEIDERRKQSFMGEARALLFPIDWPEPFGLVMIEAMACGTPVLAFRNGSVPEVIEDGVTGFIVDTEQEAICRLGALLALDRGKVRRRFEERFTARRMASDYIDLYETMASGGASRPAAVLPPLHANGSAPVS